MEHSRKTEISIEGIELKLNNKLNEEAARRQEMINQIDSQKKTVTKNDKSLQTLKESFEKHMKDGTKSFQERDITAKNIIIKKIF